ncbi:zinc finger protein 511 isoform 5-T5 [Dugong dugon]
MVKRHLYPADFRFDKPKKSRGESLPTSLSSAGQLHRGPQCLCQPKSQRVTVSSQKGTPWRSAPTDTWRPPQCLRERAWPHQGSRGSGPTATEFLPPSVSVKVRHGDLKAPRREANTTDGPSAGGEPEASDTSQGAVPPSGGGFGHGLPFSPWDRAASSCGVATLGPRPRLSLMSQPVVGGVRYQEQQELVAPDGDADHCPGRRWILALGRGRHENLVFECVK